MCDAILDGLLGSEPPEGDVAMLIMRTAPAQDGHLARPVALSPARG